MKEYCYTYLLHSPPTDKHFDYLLELLGEGISAGWKNNVSKKQTELEVRCEQQLTKRQLSLVNKLFNVRGVMKVRG